MTESTHDHEHHNGHTLLAERLPPGAWRIDQGGSEVFFKARALFGLLPVTGIFERFSGELAVREDGATSGRLVVETASIDTGITRRDADLRGPAYFDADKHPSMSFTLDSLEASGQDGLIASGSLEVRQISIPLRFPVQAIAHAEHLHLEGRVRVDHQAAGLGWYKPMLVGRTVRAEAALTLHRVS